MVFHSLILCWLQELVSKLPLQAGSQVLDVGSGLGGTVEYMAKVMKYCVIQV